MWCAIGLREGKARALVVNSGNANAFTGKKGLARLVHHRGGCGQGRRLHAPAKCSSPRPASSASRWMPASSRICSAGLRSRAKSDAFDVAARAIMTTDTYPQARDAHGRDRRRAGRHQRLLQGRRHDRARHGDDAVLHFHRCRDRQPAVLQSLLAEHVPTDVQLHDDRRRHLDQRHAACCSPPARRQSAASPRVSERATIRAARRFRRRLARSVARSGHPGRQGWRGPLQVRHHRGRQGAESWAPRAGSGWRAPTRRS